MPMDLTTTYLGLPLANPIIAASSPLTATIDTLRSLVDAGVAAAVLPSLFAEQVEHAEGPSAALLDQANGVSASVAGPSPNMGGHFTGPTRYLEHVAACKRAVSIPIIANINTGIMADNWLQYAQRMENAGADAIELNLYYVATDAEQDAASIERIYLERVAAACAELSIPVAAKLGPFFSALPNFIGQLSGLGLRGLVLFNRYLDPNLDLETMQVEPDLVLSDRHEIRLALRWIATLREQTRLSLAATGGVHFAEDVIKSILVGADAVMVAAVLIRYGPRWIETTLGELTQWLTNKEYTGVAQMKGSMSLRNCPDPAAFHRVNYLKSLTSYIGPGL